jgi:hypothetical protein
MQTIDQLIATLGITMTAQPTDHNPNMADSERMDHWRITLRRSNPRRSLTLTFSMGSGHNGAEPETADVLECLASDAAGFENATGFEDWAEEYGYDPDSRSAERTYRAVERETYRLRRFMGDEYQTLLWDTQRL